MTTPDWAPKRSVPGARRGPGVDCFIADPFQWDGWNHQNATLWIGADESQP